MVDSRNRNGKCCKPGRNPLTKVDIGTISELLAVNLLIQSGFYVARSCHVQSPFDIIAVDEYGNTLLIDVKTKTYRKKNNCKIIRVRNDKQKKMGVQIMTIDQERIKDRKEQKEFFDKLNNMLDNFPNKNMFKKKDTHNETDSKT
ncbi:hypothetical protein [uncultured Mediterranean phage uvMED]|nr:hypothetical protein [uncultured Mediterranean phage uvMED]